MTDPVTNILSTNLTPSERLVWIALKWHSQDGEGCSMPYEQIGEAVGLKWQQTKRLINNLIRMGYCDRQHRPGHPSTYTVKFPDTVVIQDQSSKTSRTGLVTHDQSFDEGESYKTSHMAQSDLSPLSIQRDLCSNTNTEQEPPNPPKGERRRKSGHLTDPEEIKAELDKINVAALQEKYPTKDVWGKWAQFYEDCLEGTPQSPTPNARKYRNFKMAFERNWVPKAQARGPTTFDYDFDPFAGGGQ